MIVLASEDIGNADPRALQIAVAAAHAVQHVGLPGGSAQPLRRRRSTSPARPSRTRATSRSRRRPPMCASTATCGRRTIARRQLSRREEARPWGRATSTRIATPPGLRSTTSRKSCGADLLPTGRTGEEEETMAIERNAKATWEGDPRGRLRRVRPAVERRDRGRAGHIRVPVRAARRQDEPRGADRRRPRHLLLDGLANGLAQDGHAPTKLETEAQVTLDNTGEGARDHRDPTQGARSGRRSRRGRLSSRPPSRQRSTARSRRRSQQCLGSSSTRP